MMFLSREREIRSWFYSMHAKHSYGIWVLIPHPSGVDSWSTPEQQGWESLLFPHRGPSSPGTTTLATLAMRKGIKPAPHTSLLILFIKKKGEIKERLPCEPHLHTLAHTFHLSFHPEESFCCMSPLPSSFSSACEKGARCLGCGWSNQQTAVPKSNPKHSCQNLPPLGNRL